MEEIKAWKPKCCNKAYIRKGSAARHEKRCPYNPDNKACATCGHNTEESNTVYVRPYPGHNYGDDDYEEYYYWCGFFEKEISKYEVAENTMQPQIHCEHWIPKEKQEG